MAEPFPRPQHRHIQIDWYLVAFISLHLERELYPLSTLDTHDTFELLHLRIRLLLQWAKGPRSIPHFCTIVFIEQRCPRILGWVGFLK